MLVVARAKHYEQKPHGWGILFSCIKQISEIKNCYDMLTVGLAE